MESRYNSSGLCNLLGQLNQTQAIKFLADNLDDIKKVKINCNDFLWLVDSTHTYKIANELLKHCALNKPISTYELSRVLHYLNAQSFSNFCHDYQRYLSNEENVIAITKNVSWFANFNGMILLDQLGINLTQVMSYDSLCMFITNVIKNSAHDYSPLYRTNFIYAKGHAREGINAHNRLLGSLMAKHLQSRLSDTQHFHSNISLLIRLKAWSGEYGDPNDAIKYELAVAMHPTITNADQLATVSCQLNNEFRSDFIEAQNQYWKKQTADAKKIAVVEEMKNLESSTSVQLSAASVNHLLCASFAGGAMLPLLCYAGGVHERLSYLLLDVFAGAVLGGVGYCASEAITTQVEKVKPNDSRQIPAASSALATSSKKPNNTAKPNLFARRSELIALNKQHESSWCLNKKG